MIAAIKLCAPNDRNGNPRRIFLVVGNTLNAGGGVLHAIDEGYAGRGGLDKQYPDCAILCSVDVTAKEYNSWKSSSIWVNS